MTKPNPERDALIQQGLFASKGRLHKMELDGTSDANFARFKCQRCGTTFAVGYRAVVGQGAGSQRLELIDRTALDRPCPGMVRVHGELRSESNRDADAIVTVANDLSNQNADWDLVVAERARDARGPLVAISWIWDARDESESTEQAVEIFNKVFRGLFPNLALPDILWTSRNG